MGSFLGCLGTLEIELKHSRESDFHTLELLFAGMIFRLDLVNDFLLVFEIFDVFADVHLGSVLVQMRMKMEGERRAEKGMKKCHARAAVKRVLGFVSL